MPNFFRSLAGVMWLAKRLQITWVKEQLWIAIMWLDMIDLCCQDKRIRLAALSAPRIRGKLNRTHGPPLGTVVQLLDCGIADDALGRVSNAAPTLDQYIAPWIGALPQR